MPDARNAGARPNSSVVAAEGERITPAEMVPICVLLFIAGFETTVNLISNGVLALLEHPEQWAALGADPALAPGAVEEILRYDAPVRFFLRRTDDGRTVVVLYGSANRDEQVFDEPDAFRIDRDASAQLAFGAGIHRCAGSNLARLELRVALQTWMERIPEFELVDPASVTWAGGQVRGPRQCRVRFTPPA